MPINTRELLSAVAILTDKQSMRVTLKSSAKGATVAGSSTFLGGLLAGPIGLLIGGTLGGLIAYAMTNNQFKPVSHIIQHELTVQEQEQLKQRIVDALSQFQPTDLMVILPLLTGNIAAQQTVISTVVAFLTNEMRMQIVD
ncbi:protein C19orf12 homolog [Anopheles maculipalpis]|uniref:protein C19orf12 homolog n=1 Tax=Anopheles maculipalpis TaxID=1496333 RepID=UPI00215933B8|nr:protein C19orf12 homolog [Anopheles maculipalpis]XP_050073278.1 protein C19orf12 homolog [Anopheles maculipalpis]